MVYKPHDGSNESYVRAHQNVFHIANHHAACKYEKQAEQKCHHVIFLQRAYEPMLAFPAIVQVTNISTLPQPVIYPSNIDAQHISE